MTLGPKQFAKQFKGWTIPGPERPDTAATRALETDIPEDQSLDAICGHFKLFQYKKGHRFSTDDLLVAGYGTSYAPTAARVLDLGSGIGSVATIAAWRLPGAQLTTVEAQEQSIALARKSMQLNGLDQRVDLRFGDFRDPGVLAPDEKFDLILGSPPYFPLTDGITAEHPQKVACRFEVRGDVTDYCKTAAPHLAPGGVLALVFPITPAHQLERVWEGAREARLITLRMRPIVLKEGEEPLLGVFLLARAQDYPESLREKSMPLWREPPLVIRCKDGSVHPEYTVFKAAIGFPP